MWVDLSGHGETSHPFICGIITLMKMANNIYIHYVNDVLIDSEITLRWTTRHGGGRFVRGVFRGKHHIPALKSVINKQIKPITMSLVGCNLRTLQHEPEDRIKKPSTFPLERCFEQMCVSICSRRQIFLVNSDDKVPAEFYAKISVLIGKEGH